MAQMTDHKQLILHCCRVNEQYMRLPAGMVEEYNLVAALYQRLAVQSRECAQAWLNGEPCPDHERAVDAFWTAVIPWAIGLGQAFEMSPMEWNEVLVYPHQEFLEYLTGRCIWEPLADVKGTPSEMIMKLDASWMSRVVYLTGKWAWLQYLGDMPVLIQAKGLDTALKEPGSAAQRAYLQSDLVFFRDFFEPFPFSDRTRQRLNKILQKVEQELGMMNSHLPEDRF